MKRDIQTLSERQKALFLKEGRGIGDGPDYVPGRTLRELRGIGRMHRFACIRCGGRQIVLPSDMALSVFLEEHWDPATSDLKDHYPLCDVEQTRRIAEKLGLRHPSLTDGSPAILITSLLVCKQQAGELKLYAVDIASWRAAGHTPTSAARQIKEEYWRRLGVPYRVAYSEGLNSDRAKHLWNLYNIAERVMSRGLTEEEKALQRAVLARCRLRRETTLLDVCHRTADKHGISRADCVAAMRRLIAMRLIDCSLDVPVLLVQPLRDTQISVAERKDEDAPKRSQSRARGRARTVAQLMSRINSLIKKRT
ncbi:TnsA endonuclease N-terminal domain-containing protein [Paraburkholderia sediminicola]|uniref:hypothetical protein n=1 Tax=Paraburkholderia sediminicola TaxID=458836 RepID=UPI0038B8B785